MSHEARYVMTEDGLSPDAATCTNCGHVHLDEEDWTELVEGTCVPADQAPTIPLIRISVSR